MPFNSSDKAIIQDLARRYAEIANDPLQEKNREMWRRHNALERVRPMVLAFPEGAWRELLPGDRVCKCEDNELRGWEWMLRNFIYRWEHLRDDNIIEPRIKIGAAYDYSDWGVEIKHRESGVDGGAWAFDPVIKDYDDLKKLRKPTLTLNEQATNHTLDVAHELFDGILPVVLYKKPGIDNSLLYMLCNLIGLDNIMLYVIDRPDFVHQAMSFMTDATLEMMYSAEKSGYVEPNNQDDYVSSGGVGYSRELPTTGSPEAGYTFMDCWGFAEAQEFSLVSPKMHEEFILQYQIKMLDRYGLNCYGCCESLSDKFDIVFKIPRLRRISISPWADIRKSAAALGDKYIFSWKPNPADLAGEAFNADLVRSKIEECVSVAKDCVLEIIMKDTHTVRNEPWRLDEWVRIAKEVAEQGYPG